MDFEALALLGKACTDRGVTDTMPSSVDNQLRATSADLLRLGFHLEHVAKLAKISLSISYVWYRRVGRTDHSIYLNICLPDGLFASFDR